MVGPQDTFLPSSVKQNCVGCGGSTGGAGGGGAGGGDTADVVEGRQRMATIISMVASMRLETIRSLTVQGCRVPLLLAAASNSCAGMPKAGGLDLEPGTGKQQVQPNGTREYTKQEWHQPQHQYGRTGTRYRLSMKMSETYAVYGPLRFTHR